MTWRLVRIVALVALIVGCGSITTVESLASVDAAHPEVSQAESGTDAPRSEVSQADGGATDAGEPMSCIGGDAGALGFAYNPGCDGGTTAPTSCHASCVLDGQHFVGCAWDDRVAAGYVVCHASCAECP